MALLSFSNLDCSSLISQAEYYSFSRNATIISEYEFVSLSPFPAEVKTLITNLGWEGYFSIRKPKSTSYFPLVVRKFYHNLRPDGPDRSHLCSVFLGHRVCFQHRDLADKLRLPSDGLSICSESDIGVLHGFDFHDELLKLTRGVFDVHALPDPLRVLHWLVVNFFLPRYRNHDIIKRLDLFILVSAQRGRKVNLSSLMCLNMLSAAPREDNWYTALPYATVVTKFLELLGMDLAGYSPEHRSASLQVFRILDLTGTYRSLRDHDDQGGKEPDESSSKR